MEEKKITFEDIQKANKIIKPMKIKRTDKKTGKTVSKDYAEVNQRLKAFRMVYPNGAIIPEMIFDDNEICKFKVTVMNDEGDVLSVAHAFEVKKGSYINQTSYIENCETSAVGRALGLAGFGIDTSISSADEVKNAINNQEVIEEVSNLPMTEEQVFMISNLDVKYKEQLRKFFKKDIMSLTFREAETSINSLKNKGVDIKGMKEAETEKKESEEVF